MTLALGIDHSPAGEGRLARLLARTRDPRPFQVATLATLLALSLGWSDFGPPWLAFPAALAASLGVQAIGSRWARLRFDPMSPLITAFSLAILMRSADPMLYALAGLIAIGSKFLIRVNGKHIFNPANVAIVCVTFAFDQAWLSPGQWGSTPWLVALLAMAGTLVLARSSRADITGFFLAGYVGLLAARILWLGDPWTILTHQVQSGALLIFAFFMISDPKTIPDHRLGRLLFALALAGLAFWLRFELRIRADVILALVMLAPLVPLIDRFLPATGFTWPRHHGVARLKTLEEKKTT